MKIQEQILVDRRRGWMQPEVQKFVEGMNVILKHGWVLNMW